MNWNLCMPTLFKIMFTLSGLIFIAGWVVVLLRSCYLGLVMILSTVVGVGLAIWAAMYSDPPSLLPVWAWLCGMMASSLLMFGWKAFNRWGWLTDGTGACQRSWSLIFLLRFLLFGWLSLFAAPTGGEVTQTSNALERRLCVVGRFLLLLMAIAIHRLLSSNVFVRFTIGQRECPASQAPCQSCI